MTDKLKPDTWYYTYVKGLGESGPFKSTDDLADSFSPVEQLPSAMVAAVMEDQRKALGVEDWSGPVEMHPVPIEDFSYLAGGVPPNAEAAAAFKNLLAEDIRKTFEELLKNNSLLSNPKWLLPQPDPPKYEVTKRSQVVGGRGYLVRNVLDPSGQPLTEEILLKAIQDAGLAPEVLDCQVASTANQNRFASQPDPPKPEPLPDTIPTTFGGQTYDLPRGEDRYERARRRSKARRREALLEALEDGRCGWGRGEAKQWTSEAEAPKSLDERIAACQKELGR